MATPSRSPMWLLLEFMSAAFVVIGLLSGIYSGIPWIRAIAGIATIILVSTATFIVLERYRRSDVDEGQDF